MARRTSPPPAAAAVEGGLIGIEPDGILGWAIDRADPATPVVLRIAAGGQIVAEVRADRFDEARLLGLVGAGIPGFVARLRSAPVAAYPLQLTLHDPSGVPLGAPLVVRQAADLAAVIGPPAPERTEGHIDGVFDGRLMGWARDLDRPDRALTLELLDGGQPIARTIANRLREDLRDAGLHGGLYGYAFDLPVGLLDGKPHSLTARVLGDRALLRGGPIAFGPLESSELLEQVAALRAEVATLKALVDGLIAPDGPAIRKVMKVLSERAAAHAALQADAQLREIAALRRMVFDLAGTPEVPETYGAPPPRDLD